MTKFFKNLNLLKFVLRAIEIGLLSPVESPLVALSVVTHLTCHHRLQSPQLPQPSSKRAAPPSVLHGLSDPFTATGAGSRGTGTSSSSPAPFTASGCRPTPPLAAAPATAAPPPPGGTGDSSPPSLPTAPTPPPETAVEAQAPPPPPPPSQLPAVDLPRLPPDNPIPAPPLHATPATTAPPPPGCTGDSSPLSPPKVAPTPPPLSTTNPSPPLSPGNQTSAPRPMPPPAPALAPTAPPPPAPLSPKAKSNQEPDVGAGESENMAPAHTEVAIPPKTQKAAAVAESPTESPHMESALTIAKLLTGEDPAATEAKTAADKVVPAVVTESVAAAGGGGGGVRSKRWLLGRVPEKVRRTELKRAELGFRVSAALFCLVSLSVMSAGTTPGWAGDSFRRYNEYRYTLAASVMAFTYSVFQLVAEVYYHVTGRRIIRGPWSNYFNLAMDQILAYLLLSASSAALSRNDVWVSRFGVDQFAKLINASASMAFLAFIALGLSSIISAYHVFSLIS